MIIFIRRLSVCVILLSLTACITLSPPSQSTTQKTVEPKPVSPQSSVDHQQQVKLQRQRQQFQEQQRQEQQRREHLRELLTQAQRALLNDDLMLPRANNAFSWYRQVLAIDSSNDEAHWGMRQITARYLELAHDAFGASNVDRAELMLKRALKVSATTDDVESIRERYKHVKKRVANNEFQLSMVDLTARNDKSITELDGLAKKAQAINSRLLIIARNDSEGRWIYQQMSQAVDGYRLRGNIEIGRTPAIVLIDMDT